MRKYILSPYTDVYSNLALEEYLVRNIDFSESELLLIYRNETAIVLGKNQNILNEVYCPIIHQNQIPIARRISGGGTVVHDMGNINFSFFEKHSIQKVNSYRNSVGFIVDVLRTLGIDCYQNERNAIFLSNDHKISGSAQFSSSRAILSHLTLLFDSDLEIIESYLKPNTYRVESKSSISIRSQIANLQPILGGSPESFVNIVLEIWGGDSSIDLVENNQMEIEKLIIEKYQNPSYIYHTACSGKISYGDLCIELERGIIQNLSMSNYNSDWIGQSIFENNDILTAIVEGRG